MSSRRSLLAVQLALTVLLLPAFPRSTAAGDRVPVRSLLEIRQANVIVQEWDISCGAAALATVLTYQLGDAVSEKQVAAGMLRRTEPSRVRMRGGFSLLDMKRYAESRGFQAAGYAPLTVAHLLKMAPAIVPLHLDGYDHFVVFRGAAGGKAVLADPAFGNRTLTLTQFEKAWNGNIGFIVTPRGRSAAANRLAPRKSDFTAVEDEAVRAASDVELPNPLNDWQLARLPFSTDRARNAMAANPAAAMGLGSFFIRPHAFSEAGSAEIGGFSSPALPGTAAPAVSPLASPGVPAPLAVVPSVTVATRSSLAPPSSVSAPSLNSAPILITPPSLQAPSVNGAVRASAATLQTGTSLPSIPSSPSVSGLPALASVQPSASASTAQSLTTTVTSAPLAASVSTTLRR